MKSSKEALNKKLRNFVYNLKDENFLKGNSTLIGAVCINFIIGAIYSLCTLSVYEISYIKEKGGSINIDHLAFYYPVEILFQCFSSFVSGFIYKEFGLHTTNLIGITILCGGYFMMFVSSSLTLDIVSMALGGIGTGIILYPSTTNSYEWFKDHNGIIVGIMETMISFGSFFFSFIGEKMINKDEIPSNDDDNLYDFEIGKGIKKYLIMQIICIICTFILSYFLMFEKNNEDEILLDIENNSQLIRKKSSKIKETILKGKKKFSDISDSDKEETKSSIHKTSIDSVDKKEKMNKNENGDFINIIIKEESEGDTYEEKNDKEEIKNDSSINDVNDEDENKKNEEIKEDLNQKDELKKESNTENQNQDKEDEKKESLLPKNEKEISISNIKEKEIDTQFLLKRAFKSKRLLLFSAIVILQSPVTNMAFSLYREIGEYKKVNTKYLQLVGSLYFIFECLSSFIFGILCDYIQIKQLLYFINFVGTFAGFVYCLTFENSLIFFLVQNFLSFSAGGYYPVKDCYLMKVFGKDIYIELSGYVSFLVAITINLLTPISYFVQSWLENRKDTAYWILFLTFGALNLVGLILNFFLKETPIPEEINEDNIL